MSNSTVTPQCIMKLLTMDNNVRLALQSFLYSVVFIRWYYIETICTYMHSCLSPLSIRTTDSNPLHDSVSIIGLQEVLCSDRELVIDPLSHIEYIGNLISMHVSKNSLHLLTAVSRKKLDLDGTLRLYEICAQLASRPDDKFLAGYSTSCSLLKESNEGAPKFSPYLNHSLSNSKGEPTLNDFIWFTSSCPPSTLCPSFYEMDVRVGSPAGSSATSGNHQIFIPDGIYTLRSTESFLCEAGYFCKQGIRNQCPGSAL
jgi:hypothetical protein